MQVPDEIRKCIVFIAYKTQKEMRFGGTGFFVSYELSAERDTSITYLVTARHILKKIRDRCVEDRIYLRANLTTGAAELFPVSLDSDDHWLYHDDQRNDVAISVMSMPRLNLAGVDYRTIDRGMIVDQEAIESYQIGIGNEVFMSGLFTRHYGKDKNIPIIRVGNIAAMPEQPVKTDYGDMSAYLVECRSIGGLSGCPMFVYVGGVNQFRLLGLMHGHWSLADDAGDAPLVDGFFDNERLNTGIGVVVPSQAILDILDSPSCEAYRQHFQTSSMSISTGAESLSSTSTSSSPSSSQSSVSTSSSSGNCISSENRRIEL